jgi:hypothetical protein
METKARHVPKTVFAAFWHHEISFEILEIPSLTKISGGQVWFFKNLFLSETILKPSRVLFQNLFFGFF